jgi:hypothetical protein
MSDTNQFQFPFDAAPLQSEAFIEQDSSDLFEDVGSQQYGPDYNNLIASMAGLGMTMSVGGDPTKAAEEFQRNSAIALSMMESNNEDKLRLNMARQRVTENTNILTGIIQDELVNPDADLELIQGAITLSDAKSFEIDQDALEKQAFDRIADLALADPTNLGIATLMLDNKEYGDFVDKLQDQLERRFIMQRNAMRIASEYEDQGFMASAIDMIASIIPLNYMTTQNNLLEGTIKSILTGNANFETTNKLLSMPREEFDEAIPKVYAAIKEQSGWFGTNLLISSEAAHNLLSVGAGAVKGRNRFDFLDFSLLTVDVATLFQTRVFGVLGKIPILRRGSARELAAELAFKTIDDVGETASDIGAETTVKGAVDEAMPSAIAVHGDDIPGGDIRISGIVTQKLEVQQRAIDILMREIAENSGRISDDSLERAVEAAIAQIRNELGNVVDFKVVDTVAARQKVVEEVGRRAKASRVILEAAEKARDAVKARLQAAWDKAFKAAGVARLKLEAAEKAHVAAKNRLNDSSLSKEEAVIGNPKYEKFLDDIEVEAAKVKAAKDNLEAVLAKNRAKEKDSAGLEDELEVAEAKVVTAMDSHAAVVLQGAKDVDAAGLGSTLVNVVLGRRGGNGGFVSSSAAKGQATRMGIPDPVIFQGVDTQWYIRKQFSVDERNFMAINGEKATQSGPISTFLRSSASLQDESLQARAVQAGFHQSRYRRMIKRLAKPIGDLSKKSKLAVEAVWEEGNIAQKWFSPNEFAAAFNRLNKRMPTQAEYLGYKTLQQINDFDYFMHNHDLYLKRSTDGWVTGQVDSIDFSVLPTNMMPVKQVSSIDNMVIYDLGNNQVIEGKLTNLASVQERLRSGEELFKLTDTIDTLDGAVGYIIGKRGMVKTSVLKYNQLNYSAGGHRLYVGRYFIKQAQVGKTATGITVIKNPKTFAVARTRVEATEWADRWNDMITTYLKYVKNPAAMEREMVEALARGGFDDGLEAFEKMVKKEKLDGEHRFEVAFDREEPSAYKTLRNRSDVYDQTSPIGPHESYWEVSGRMYYSRKGPPLLGPQEERARFISPFKTATMAIETNARRVALTNYRISAINSWMKTFGVYLPKNGKSAEANFFSDIALQTGDSLVQQRAEQLRTIIKRQLGTQTSSQEAMGVAVRRFSEWIEGTGDTAFKKWASRSASDIFSRNPIKAMKALAFDLKLGLFEPSQLLIQTQTAAAMAFVDPKGFALFARDVTPIRWALHNGTDELTSELAKFTSMDKAEFKQFMRLLNEQGSMDVGTEMIYLDRTQISIGNPVQTIRDFGRLPFYEAERLNRIAAFRISWRRMRESGISMKDMATSGNRAKLANMTDKFSMNMTHASSAAWQEGVLSAATQFLSYQMRFVENVLPFIGSKQWTGAEKFRLAASQMALYGAAGVPMGGYIANKIFVGDPEGRQFAEDNPTVYRLAVGGVIDAFLYAVSGGELDVAFSDRVSIFKGVEETYKKMWGDDIGESSFLEMLGGAPLNIAMDLGSDVLDAVRYIQVAAHSERVAITDVTPLIMQSIAENASVYSRATKMYLALKYGQVYSSRTGKAITDVTTPEAFALGLGINPREFVDIGTAFDMIGASKQTVKNLSVTIGKLRNEANRAIRSGDMDKANRLQDIIAGHLSMLSNEERWRVSTMSWKSDSLVDMGKTMRWMLFKETGNTTPSLDK